MTLTVSVQKTQEEELQIEVPSFWRNRATNEKIFEYIAILDEKTCCKVTMWDDYVVIKNCTHTHIDLADLGRKSHFCNYQPVTETEFISIYSEALEAASLTPRLVEKTFVDDLESIGVNRKEKTYEP